MDLYQCRVCGTLWEVDAFFTRAGARMKCCGEEMRLVARVLWRKKGPKPLVRRHAG